jgi:AcrR family transcriptional regulator
MGYCVAKDDDEGSGRREHTRKRILDAARTVVKKHGMNGATIRKIADEAGVSPGLVMQYFQTKAELIQEIFLESNKILMDKFQLNMESAKSFLEMAMGALEAMSARDLHDPDLTRQVMAFTWSWGPEEERKFSQTLLDMSDILANSMSSKYLPNDIEHRRVASFALVNVYVGYLRIALQENWSREKLLASLKPAVGIIIVGQEAMSKQDDAKNAS